MLEDAPAPASPLTGRSTSWGRRWDMHAHGTSLLRAVVPVVLVLLLWYLIAEALDQPRIFPSPEGVASEIARILRGDSATASSSYAQALATARRALAAFGLSFLAGSLLGIIAGKSRYLFNLFSTLMWPIVAIPAIVWAFIFLIIMGISEAVPISAVAILLTPLVLIHVAEGTKSMPPELIALCDAYKIGLWRRLVDVYVPFLVPYLVTSARVVFAITLKIIFVVEVVGLPTGVGFDINYWYNSVFLAPVVAWGVLTLAVGIFVDYAIFGPLERIVSKGRPAAQGRVAATLKVE